jgi:hypothetical protein
MAQNPAPNVIRRYPIHYFFGYLAFEHRQKSEIQGYGVVDTLGRVSMTAVVAIFSLTPRDRKHPAFVDLSYVQRSTS